MRLVEIAEGVSVNPDNVISVMEDSHGRVLVWCGKLDFARDKIELFSSYSYEDTRTLLEGQESQRIEEIRDGHAKTKS